MPPILLSDLTEENVAVELHLKLSHAWFLENPSKPGLPFGYGTHWIDAEGTRIQGESHKDYASTIEKEVVPGSVYIITGFGLRPRRKNYRTCTFPHCLDLTPNTKFILQPPTTPPFPDESLQYIKFEDFYGREHPPYPYLTDFVGKLVAAGDPNHVQRESSVARVQNLTLANERGAEVVVSLWGDLADVVDATALAQSGDSRPTIIACAAFRITKFADKFCAATCSASRVFLQRRDRWSNRLRSHFRVAPRPIEYVPPRFGTAEMLREHVRASYRTISELITLHVSGGHWAPHYRCTALIKGFESQQPWSYKACPHCSRAVVPNHYDFWCFNHETIPASDVQHKYRLKLAVSDSTGETTFILLGMTAERILPIPAAELARAYPRAFGSFPPAIEFLVGQTVEFEVQLPKFNFANPFGDFKVCNISGLAVPRAQLVANLPSPVPDRSPSPPPTHNTPMPGDPEYVGPLPPYVPPPASPPFPPPAVVTTCFIDHSDKEADEARTITKSRKKKPLNVKTTSTKAQRKSNSESSAKPPRKAAVKKNNKQAGGQNSQLISSHLASEETSAKAGRKSNSQPPAKPPLKMAGKKNKKCAEPHGTNQLAEDYASTSAEMEQGTIMPDAPEKSDPDLSNQSVLLEHTFSPHLTETSSRSKLPLPPAEVEIKNLQHSSSAARICSAVSAPNSLDDELGRGKRKQIRRKVYTG